MTQQSKVEQPRLRKPRKPMTTKQELACARNYGGGRLSYVLNNLRSFTYGKIQLTETEEFNLAQAIAKLESMVDNWSDSNQQLGLKK